MTSDDYAHLEQRVEDLGRELKDHRCEFRNAQKRALQIVAPVMVFCLGSAVSAIAYTVTLRNDVTNIQATRFSNVDAARFELRISQSYGELVKSVALLSTTVTRMENEVNKRIDYLAGKIEGKHRNE